MCVARLVAESSSPFTTKWKPQPIDAQLHAKVQGLAEPEGPLTSDELVERLAAVLRRALEDAGLDARRRVPPGRAIDPFASIASFSGVLQKHRCL